MPTNPKAKAKATKSRKTNKQRGSETRPKRALLFDLSEVPPSALEELALPKGVTRSFGSARGWAEAVGVSARIIAYPFYAYDARYARTTKLPPERKLLPAEEKRGYAFLDALMQVLVERDLMSDILDGSEDPIEWYAGWHNSATIGELGWALAHSGFHVVRFTDLFDPSDSNRIRLKFGQPNPKIRV
jgi:hypothetical protein